MDTISIQLTETEYRLVINGTPTEAASYGEALECESGGHKYLAFLDLGDDEGAEVESELGSWVYVDGVGIDVDLEDVEGESFDGGAAGDDDREDEDDDYDDGDDDEGDDEGDEDEEEEPIVEPEPEVEHNVTQK
jgi:hypothetical protein